MNKKFVYQVGNNKKEFLCFYEMKVCRYVQKTLL